jgi:hypothetical protein
MRTTKTTSQVLQDIILPRAKGEGSEYKLKGKLKGVQIRVHQTKSYKVALVSLFHGHNGTSNRCTIPPLVAFFQSCRYCRLGALAVDVHCRSNNAGYSLQAHIVDALTRCHTGTIFVK